MKAAFEAVVKKANVIFDDREWEKTVMLAVDEHLLQFMHLAIAGERSPNTLEKMWGRKKRLVEFLRFRYNMEDLTIRTVEFKFAEQLLTYNISQRAMIENSAMKYVQMIKEVFTRAVSIGWLTANIFDSYSCHYDEVDQEWLAMDDMFRLKDHTFGRPQLNEVRDIYVFASFTGYAYAELDSAVPTDLRVGVDGKQWISKDHQKTGTDETI